MVPFYEQKKELLQTGTGNHMEFPLHLHLALELLYVIEGEINAKIGSSEYSVHSGELALMFPNTVHDYSTVSKREDTEFIMVIASPLLAGDFKNTLLCAHPVYPIISSNAIHQDAVYAIKALLADKSGNNELSKLFIQLILTRVMPHLKLESNQNLSPHDLTAQVISYISEHFSEPLSLEILSKKFGASRYQISRIFSKTIDVKYYDYINTLRINYAKSLLQNTDQDILSIGFDCGFENQQTFNRVFKVHCNVSPKRYRKIIDNTLK
ncbi:HTH-type transcriptional activator RhaR [bioreactor metagenome]|uniref:HTH-type transcriptional activator RhaR n=1 Tax=bioreactor metagenome TaxID=1076179 RepID=A0A645D051_9ZZZZ